MCAVPIRKEYRTLQPSDIVPLFMLFKRAAGLAPSTLEDYKTTLGHFFSQHPDGLDFPRERTMEYLSGYENPCSYNVKYAYLKVFWDWTIVEGYYRGDRHPLDGLKKRRPRGRIVQLSEDEVKRLLKQPDKRMYAGARDFALLCLSIDTGIRPGEALQLLPEDFSAEKREIHVRAEVSKTRTPRILPLADETIGAVRKLLQSRPREWESAPIFANNEGGTLAVSTWTNRVKTYGEECGLRITSYSLRHVAALLLLRRGADAFTVQRIMGHTTMQMTRNYVNLTSEDTRRGHAAAGVLHAVLRGESGGVVKKKRIGKL